MNTPDDTNCSSPCSGNTTTVAEKSVCGDEISLKEREERYRHVCEITSDYIHMCTRTGDEHYRVKWLAGAVEAITGYTREEMAAKGCWLAFVHPDDLQQVHDDFMGLRPGERSDKEFRLVGKQGNTVWIRNRSYCEAGSEPGELRLFGACEDISERKRAEEELHRLNQELEKRVRERTLQLEKANRELESFCYSVSHDLRAPLRHMSGYSRMLLEEYGSRLDDRGASILSHIEEGGKKMGDLIDALLNLSRINRSELHLRPVNLTKLAEEVMADLQKENPEREVEVAIAPGLAACGDPLLLRSVLANLLGNAWKYTHHTPGAHIEFGTEEREGEALFFVRDNGVGFDMQKAGKLFAPFQRLHSDKEFEGTGIGLATAQQIIHRHGGDIWAEAEKGEGAVFRFTLPLPDEGEAEACFP